MMGAAQRQPHPCAQQSVPRDRSGAVVPFPPAPDPGAIDMPGPDLGPVAAARIEHWCRAYDLPLSTLRALRAQGKGPKTFEIGRLIYCMRGDWRVWLEGLATIGGSGPLSPPAGRFGRRTNHGTTEDTSPR